MKKILLTLLVVGLVGAVSAQKKEVDTNISNITWLGEKVTGEHSGNISFKSGQLKYNNDKLVGGELLVDMQTITCTDIENEEYNKKLVGHLKSDDFFGVDKHALSTLKVKSVKGNSDAYDITADLTIKGKTHPVTFSAKQQGNKLTGSMKVDRTLYDIRYGSGQFFDDLGDKMIYDEFTLTFSLVVK